MRLQSSRRTVGPGLSEEARIGGKVRITAKIGPKATQSWQTVLDYGVTLDYDLGNKFWDRGVWGIEPSDPGRDALKACVLQGEAADSDRARSGRHHELSGEASVPSDPLHLCSAGISTMTLSN